MAGRKLSFKTYLLREGKRLTSAKDNRLSSLCNNLTYTALPYIHIYANYYSDLPYFMESLNNNHYKGHSLPKLPKDYNKLSKFKETNNEYYKVLQGYSTYLDHVSASSNLKRLYHSKFQDYVRKPHKSLCDICADTGVSQGNLTQFLKGDLSKLSLEKCRKLNDALKISSKA